MTTECRPPEGAEDGDDELGPPETERDAILLDIYAILPDGLKGWGKVSEDLANLCMSKIAPPTADADLLAAREEIARLTKERDAARGDAKGLRERLDTKIAATNAYIKASRAKYDKDEARIEELEAALRDMYAGWRYIRQNHGDLYGVAWDRCEDSARAALNASAGEQ